MKTSVDTILYHAKVYTVNPQFAISEAIAIHRGKIVAVGSDEDILGAFAAQQTIDLHGSYVYPGLVDAHAHIQPYGESLFEADLVGCTSYEDMVERVRRFAETHPAQSSERSKWILGRGWDQNLWKDTAMPTRTLLDKYFPDRPVFLRRIDIHAAVVNSVALRMAGISPDTTIEGGEIGIAQGELTGLLVDEAQTPVRKLIPDASAADQKAYIRAAAEVCYRYGLTGVGDAYLDVPQVQFMWELQQEKQLPLRVNGMIPATQANLDFFLDKKQAKAHPYRTTDSLRLESFKLFADGALGSRGAWLLAPYSDKPDTHGLALLNEQETLAVAKRIRRAGKQLCTHAIGDAANRFVLRSYAKVLPQKNTLRWRVEHAQMVHPDDLPLFKAFGILPSVQPTHPTSDMKWLPDRIGQARLQYSCQLQTLLQQLGVIALGSDFPVESVNPLLGFYAAITRQNVAAEPIAGFLPHEKLSRADALRGFTLWNAYAEHSERQKGSIEAGKFADLTVLDTDIMTCQPTDMLSAKVQFTFIGGEIVYRA